MSLRRPLVFALCLFIIFCGMKNVGAQAPPTVESVLMQYHISNTIPELRAALKNKNPDVRALVARILANDRDVGSIPLLREALKKEHIESVRLSLAASLASLKDQEGLDALGKTCDDGSINQTTRLMAANQLLDAGGNGCTRSVIEILGDTPDAPSRELGLQYLRRTTLVASSLLPRLRTVLLNELRDASPMNRLYASECISVFGDANSVPALESAIAAERDRTTRLHLEENLDRLKARLGH